MKINRELSGILAQIYLSLMLILIIGTLITAEAAEIGGRSGLLNVENGLISAELDSVALNRVLENIKMINGLEYQGDKDILNEKITISFDNLTVEKGLKRILSKFNFTMAFDSNGMPSSVYIFGKKDYKTGDIRAAGNSASSEIRESVTRQIETREISTLEKKERRQFKTSTKGPETPGKIVKVPLPDNSKGDRRDISDRTRPR